MQTFDMTDQVILITGAARGLGYAYAETLLKAGAAVALHDGGVTKDGTDPDPAIAQDAAHQLDSPNCAPFAGLLNSRADCHALVQAVHDRFGRIDGLIHNAGVVTWHDTTEVTEDDYRTATAINHDAAFWLCQAVLPDMREHGYGRILLTSSGWAFRGQEGSDRLTLYCLSKAAQLGLGMSLATGAGHEGIQTNVLAPVAKTRVYVRDVGPGEMDPQAVAGAAAWLVSPQCSLNGQIVKAADGRLALSRIEDVADETLGADAADPAIAGAALERLAR